MFNIFKFFRKEKLSDAAMETDRRSKEIIQKAVMSFYSDAMREADRENSEEE